MSRHAAEGESHERGLNPQQLRTLSMAALVTGAIAGAVALALAAVMWRHEQLITPHGWIVIAGMMVMGLCVYGGVTGLMRARDREHQASSAHEIERLVAIVKLLEPLVPALLSAADLQATLAGLVERAEHVAEQLIIIEKELEAGKRATTKHGSQVATVLRELAQIKEISQRAERVGEVHRQLFELLVAHGLPRQADGADRDARWMADMAAFTDLGKELERKRREIEGGED